jgi:hypothetical protein
VRAIGWTFATRRAWVVAAGLLAVYGVLYLIVAKALVVDPGARFSRFGALPNLVVSPLSVRDLSDWLRPAFVLYASDTIVLAPSAPVIVTVLVLGVLVGVNGAMAVEAVIRRPPGCDTAARPWWVTAVVPSFLASFSCCAPTVLILLGGDAAGAVVSVVPFVVPAAVALLFASLLWSARQLERASLSPVR